MGARLYVGNLAYAVTETELRQLFEGAGPVKSVQIPIDRNSQASKGFGFVEFEESKDAAQAIALYNGVELRDRKLAVNEARPRN